MSNGQCKLTEKFCVPCEGGIPPLDRQRIEALLKEVSGWAATTEIESLIFRIFSFQNYHETMAFVNAVAQMSHHENHHPVLVVTYNECLVKYQTHAIKGLSENDFICAAKVNELFTNFG